ncbi:hypothetical protein GJ496_009296 [Pomphorhynchus laevis]|nr:hypothetical protein GJ496_009296 [Pomphorhynchus laevis]
MYEEELRELHDQTNGKWKHLLQYASGRGASSWLSGNRLKALDVSTRRLQLPSALQRGTSDDNPGFDKGPDAGAMIAADSEHTASVAAVHLNPIFPLTHNPNIVPIDAQDPLESMFNDMVRWKHNLFRLSLNKHSKPFIAKMAKIYDGASKIQMSLTRAFILGHLVLQRCHKLTSKRVNATLSRRMNTWLSGDIQSLYEEACYLQELELKKCAKNASQSGIEHSKEPVAASRSDLAQLSMASLCETLSRLSIRREHKFVQTQHLMNPSRIPPRQVHAVMKRLIELGPAFGFYINTSKCMIYTNGNNPAHIRSEFSSAPVGIVENGILVLGAPIGNVQFMTDYTKSKIKESANSIDRIEIANVDVQVAYTQR